MTPSRERARRERLALAAIADLQRGMAPPLREQAERLPVQILPRPTAAMRPSTPQAGQVSGIGRSAPHWWQTRRRWNRCSTMRASQCSQPIWWPQARQTVTGA